LLLQGTVFCGHSGVVFVLLVVLFFILVLVLVLVQCSTSKRQKFEIESGGDAISLWSPYNSGHNREG